jgi:hypothetical protein
VHPPRVYLQSVYPLVADGGDGAVLVGVEPRKKALARVDDEVRGGGARGHHVHEGVQLLVRVILSGRMRG